MTMLKETLFLRTFGFFKIPMLFFLKPTVLQMDAKRTIVRIPLNRHSKNHLNSMYFGALCAGADCAGGLLAMKLIRDNGNAANLVFKDFKADFLKRPEGAVHFICDDGAAIDELVKTAMRTGERENLVMKIHATCPEKTGDEPVAKFELTLSIKRKKSKDAKAS